MSVLEFIASLVGSLAWPAAVVAIVVVFRAQMRTLLGGVLHRLKVGPLELEWEERWEEQRSTAQGTLPDDTDVASLEADTPIVVTETLSELERLATEQPVVSILMAWSAVEHGLKSVLRGHVPEGELERSSPGRLSAKALSLGLIDQNIADAVRHLANMRNLAVHRDPGSLTTERAVEFLTIAETVLILMEPRG